MANSQEQMLGFSTTLEKGKSLLSNRSFQTAAGAVALWLAASSVKLPEPLKEHIPEQTADIIGPQSAEAQAFNRNRAIFDYCNNLGEAWYQSGSVCVGPNGATVTPPISRTNPIQNYPANNAPSGSVVIIDGKICVIGDRTTVRRRIIPNKTTITSIPQINCGEPRSIGRDDD